MVPTMSAPSKRSRDRAGNLPYKRARFSSRLPGDRLYTASHCWLEKTSDGAWKVGFTKFATRMLGELVEHEFETASGDPIQLGQVIGWVEGFKAVADLFCIGTGSFASANDELAANPDLIRRDPYGKGWLYSFTGEPDPNAVDVNGYADFLDLAIDRILEGEIH
jgi:glycine cleavage system H protein